MAEIRLSPEAEAELDEIWLYIARESGSIEVATRVVAFGCWRYILTLDDRETRTCGQAFEASRLVSSLSFIVSRKTMPC